MVVRTYYLKHWIETEPAGIKRYRDGSTRSVHYQHGLKIVTFQFIVN